MPRCLSDDCDQVHCADCGCHTVGNELVGGLCQDCAIAIEDDYNEEMNKRYQAKWGERKALPRK